MKKFVLVGLIANVLFVLLTAYTYWNVSRALPKAPEPALIEERVEKMSKASSPQINEVAAQLFRDINEMYASCRGMSFWALNAMCIVTVFNMVFFAALLVQGRKIAEKSKE